MVALDYNISFVYILCLIHIGSTHTSLSDADEATGFPGVHVVCGRLCGFPRESPSEGRRQRACALAPDLQSQRVPTDAVTTRSL